MPGSNLPGQPQNLPHDYYIAALHHFVSIAKLDSEGLGLFVNTKFKINDQTFDVVGFVDSGNTFFNCISEKMAHRLGFQTQNLWPSPTPSVQQAGAGATLQVLGILPQIKKNDALKFKGLQKWFPFQPTYVIRGLNHDFNISLAFLKKHKFNLDLLTDSLNYFDNLHTTHIPFISKKPTIAVQKLSPLVPKQGLTIEPKQSVVVRASGILEGSIFAPREPNFSSLKAKTTPLFKDENDVSDHWQVHQKPDNPQLYTIRNCSPKPRKIYNNFKIGSLCKIVLPNKQELEIAVQTPSKKKDYIKSKINIEQQFEKKFLEKLHDLLLSFSDVISFDGEPGLTHLGKTYIQTPLNCKPIYCPQNKLSPDVFAIIEKQIKKWLLEGVIVPIDGPGTGWNARLIVVPKKKVENEPISYRVCVDLRHLNKLAMIDYSPFSPFSMQETFHNLGGSVVFSSIDLTQAFNSIPIHEKHQHKTAFCLNGQTYYFAKTPFGLASAPASLGKILAAALKNVPPKVCVYYMDDLIVHSQSISAHIHHIRIVLQALLNAGLKISLPKCKFFRTSLEFLGHLITTDGYTLIRNYIDPILNWPMVTSKYDTMSFLGSANYYNEFIKNYAEKARPLFKILSRSEEPEETIEFTKQEQNEIWQAMNALKTALTKRPILAFADFSENAACFILDSDYSQKHHTIGAVLSQIQPPGSGIERVIAYKAKALKPVQKSYSAYKGEIFSACYFMKKLRFFLQLRHFILRIDCISLKWLSSQEQIPSGIALRWIQCLAQNSFTVIHRKREEHQNADSLSRCPNPTQVSSSDEGECLASLANSETSKISLDCPFCSETLQTETHLDFHVETEHVTLDRMSFKDWLAVQKLKNNHLQSAYESDPTCIALAKTPVKLESFSDKITEKQPSTKVNSDGSITYSAAQWKAFQRLDPPLRLAMDALNKVELVEPVSKTAHPFVQDGLIENGLLKYKLFANRENSPRHLTVVPFVLQIPTLLYFHQKLGCADQTRTIREAKKFVYFKNMQITFEAMQKRCHACALRNKPMPKNHFQLISHTYIEPWYAISVDHIGPISPPIKGNSYIFSVKDLFSGWIELFPCPNTQAVHVCEILALEIVARYGVPNIILSDNHTAFTSDLYKRFCKDLGITIRHSAARNPTSNWVERAHSDFKKKTNSLLRQQELNSHSRYFCDACEREFQSSYKLRRHLDEHQLDIISEATLPPKKEVEHLIGKELQSKEHSNWVATLPAVLWQLRFQPSSTRGASPYQILFSKLPTTSLDLLYGQPVQKDNFENLADFLRAKHRKYELCEAHVKRNLAKQLIRQRQYYIGNERSFSKGDWVYLFTPVPVKGVSEKISTFWTGPWAIDEKLASTTYRIVPIPGKFAGSFEPAVVQVDRIKKFYETDVPVTPPPNFQTSIPDYDPDLERLIPQQNPEPAHWEKALGKEEDPIEEQGGNLISTPPWQSNQIDNIPMDDLNDSILLTSKEEIKKRNKLHAEKRVKEKQAEKRLKIAKKFANLPAPPLTRARKTQQSINSLSEPIDNSESSLALNYPTDEQTFPDVAFWDSRMYHRYKSVEI
ncbi:MAG: reverse transcriptase domain-containing protein [Pseudomonadota bacterium]|nr:reverse transcriptase domain-containing protein [Pseudomonadota bacterium]